MTCPLCGSDDTEPCRNGMVLCGPCNRAWYPERPQRLYDPEPRKRRDTDG